MRIGMVLGDSSGGLIGMIDQIVQAEADGFDNFSIGQVFGGKVIEMRDDLSISYSCRTFLPKS